ncbi:anti-sigma factor [Devosia sp. ZB163]|uniref:anti-sigma factor n=1 Tax=Devosia sp. ZB163 TaxID=3025938 RepID=UPI002361DC01|nr:anti-sigma factor [Devosia sp. ZB163]MDC9823262.1 anti-sigma factor [Devosia sp. ZB163]
MSTEGHGRSGEDDQVLVAEYALGLLEGGERAAFARRLATEPALAAELKLWRSRLSTLDREFAEEPAPAHVLERIERRLFGDAAPARAGWWNSLPLWRGLTATAAAVAVLAIGFNLMQPRIDPAQLATQLVAAIESQEGFGVEFIAVYDEALGQVRVTSLRGDAVPDRDYELWYIKGDQPAVSMGVLPMNERREIPLDADARASIEPGTVFAVTLEQKGGSPTGVAQGPIVAVGTARSI